MKCLELFAGSRSIGKACDALGIECFSTDITQFGGIDLVADILTVDIDALPDADIIWASPPCTSFSIAAVSHHWKDGKPISAGAVLGLALLHKTLQIIEVKKPAVWFIENPRGMMRKRPEMKNLPRASITYCQYGDTRMKPTDIWTNCTTWLPKPMCKPRASCHEAAPRGSKTGTQGLKNNHLRSIIPHDLCMSVMEAAKNQINGQKHIYYAKGQILF